jgi:hypothetical protein
MVEILRIPHCLYNWLTDYSVGELPYSGFSPSAHASAHALLSVRMWEAAVRGTTGRLHPTAGDFHLQGNPAEVTPVEQ